MIFYFSGTGNTKWAAARLAAATHEDLIPIAPYMRADDSSHNIAEPFILKRMNGSDSFSPYMAGEFHAL